ncbi:MAG: aldehyde dehydrogenase family protein, partial [Planctomycetes bacterium]|nr:aldehyde dehydrogenase family protein [Planctomycetota bacterium]
AEKAACAILAGMPVITKPATSSAMVTERCVEILVEAGAFPAGVFQFIAGGTGDLISRLGAQDVLAFTGSADTALRLRSAENLLSTNARVNLEADSLNAAVLGGDVEEGSETWDLFLRDVAREITQKSGQKCTAVRRVFVPNDRVDAVIESLSDALSSVVVGDPSEGTVNMGPLATRQQLEDAVAGVAKLAAEGAIVHGSGERVDGVGAEPGRGYFFAPTLVRAHDGMTAEAIHRHEVFGPCATVIGYDGTPGMAAQLVARADGTLVTSLYSDDLEAVESYMAAGGCYTGRLYLGSEKMAEQAPGSGIALPQSLHGGPGRAGGGAELGGRDGLRLYMQRVALQGSRPMIDRIFGANE